MTSTTTPTATGADVPGTEHADYTAELSIAAPRERVFEALTTLPGLAGWWTRVSGSGAEGGELRFVFDGDEPCVMRVTSTTFPSEVRWFCLGYAPLADWAGTTVDFTLRDGEHGGSVLAFVHHGLTPQLECYADCKNGWDFFLPSLRAFVESGEGRPYGSSGDVHRRELRDASGASAGGDSAGADSAGGDSAGGSPRPGA